MIYLKMAISKTLLLMLTISNMCINIYGLKICDDCVKSTNCPNAVAAFQKYGHSAKLLNLFMQAKCSEGDRRIFSVCCSDFSNIMDPILSHENFELLADSCPDVNSHRLLPGLYANMYELPWMTLLAYYDDGAGPHFLCTGSILTSRYILTAAHCVTNMNIVGVRVGEYDLRTNLDCVGIPPNQVCEGHIQDLLVEDVKIHEEYTTLPFVKNDIALLRLKESISFSHKNVARVCLPLFKDLRQPLTDFEYGIVAGWALTGTEQSLYELLKQSFTILKRISVPLISNVTCAGLEKENGNYPYRNVGLEFCAGEPGKGACKGDAGSPFLIERVHNGHVSYYQYGIVSRGLRACGKSVDIYTNVLEYLEWILNNIKP